MYNRVIMVGRLTRDPEMRYLEQSGTALTKARLASGRSFKDPKTGETREETCFVDVVCWGRTAEVVNSYVKKGHLVLVEGRLTYRQWETDTGEKRSAHEITADTVKFLERSDGGEGGGRFADEETSVPTPSASAPASRRRAAPAPSDDSEDDIPF